MIKPAYGLTPLRCGLTPRLTPRRWRIKVRIILCMIVFPARDLTPMVKLRRMATLWLLRPVTPRFPAISVVLVSLLSGFGLMLNATAAGVVHSGYLGGMYDDLASGIAVDGAGNAYITGTTGSPNFPETVGTNGTPHGSIAPFVAKFSPSGALLYSTIIGGLCDGLGYAIAVDGTGNAYITGRANTCILGPGSPPGVLVAKLNPFGGLAYLYVFGA